MWEGVGDRTELLYLTPTLIAVSVVSFSFCRCSTGGPEAHSVGWWLSLLHIISNSSEPQGPFGLMWLSLPHLVYNYVRSLTATNLTSVWTELYNSSTPTQSPTRSLEEHDWSSSSGNNCHAVHRSLSSGASVYECTMGIFFYLVPFHQPISAHAISSHNCHSNVSLPSGASLWMAFLGRSKVKIPHIEDAFNWSKNDEYQFICDHSNTTNQTIFSHLFR